MKIFGYPRRTVNEDGLIELEDITFQAEPEILTEIGKFILEMAETIKSKNGNFDHSHLQDKWKGWKKEYPDVIVAK